MITHRIEATRRLGAAALLVLLAACGTPVRDSRACTDDTDCRRGQRCGSRGCVSFDAPDSGCVPASCAGLSAQCGQFDDGCGGTLVCGDCPDGGSCDPDGRCATCVDSRTDAQLCLERGADCGTLTITNRCGAPRTLDCGVCSGADSCGGGGVANVCGEAENDCATRYDCPDGFICQLGRCVAPADTCQQDTECPRGQICNFSQWCEAGCVDARDCDSPALCHPQDFVCEPCSRDNPCAAGLSCLDGECQAAAACTTTQDCVDGGYDGTVCRDGFCANCKRPSDCSGAPYLDGAWQCALDGICRQEACDDETCRAQLGSLGYCDTASNRCLTRECLSDADCTEAGAVCRLSDFVCVASGCDTAICQSECAAQGLRCNTATCRCSGAPGGPGDPCVEAADCSDGYVCGNGVCAETPVTSTGEPCDANTCLLETCFGEMTGRACDQMACYMAVFLGTPVWCG